MVAGYFHIRESQFGQGSGSGAQDIERFAYGYPGGVAGYEKEIEALEFFGRIGLAEHGIEIGYRTVGNPGFHTVDDVTVVGLDCARGDIAEIGAGFRLGQAEAGYFFTAHGRQEVFFVHYLGAEMEKKIGPHQTLHGGNGGYTHQPPGQFFADDAVKGVIAARTAPVFGVSNPEDTHLPDFVEYLPGEFSLGIDFLSLRDQFIVNKAGNAFSDEFLGV
jgi:hypothetical protein